MIEREIKMKEIFALIIAIVRVIVAIILTYWAIKYAMSAVKFFNEGYDFFKSVSTNIPPHLLLCS